MTKYNSGFKAKIIHEYITTSNSSQALGRKYNIDSRLIRGWIQRYRSQGINSLKWRRGKRTFTTEFKLSVINYYQTHEESMAEV